MKQGLSRKAIQAWVNLGPRFLPFADVASDELPLGRLLRLSLFQVSVGMVLVLLLGTLNRVMIVELGVPASLVSAHDRVARGVRTISGAHWLSFRQSSLPARLAPRALHLERHALAIRRLRHHAVRASGPRRQGAGRRNTRRLLGTPRRLSPFSWWVRGCTRCRPPGLALATDLTPAKSHAKVVGLMYVMLLVGMILSALIFGLALVNFTPGRLVQVVQGAAVASIVLNGIALWQQETRRPPRGLRWWRRRTRASANPGPGSARVIGPSAGWSSLASARMAFAMADILLEPFGGEVLGFSVSATTKLTALFALRRPHRLCLCVAGRSAAVASPIGWPRMGPSSAFRPSCW
jgi:MFS transporter, BCD family, chlorophyll transporter